MSFQEKVYELCRKVPKGRVTTYKAIGDALGIKAYRAVGNALNKNRFASVPCHRVVCSDSKVGGFAHGVEKKVEMLRMEGVCVKEGKMVDFEKKGFLFSAKHRGE